MLKFMLYLIFSVPEVSLPSFSASLEQMVKLHDAISVLVPVASAPPPPSHSTPIIKGDTTVRNYGRSKL